MMEKCTIVVPFYNESERIMNHLPALLGFLKENNFTGELILVSDGSDDETIGLWNLALGKMNPLLFQVIPLILPHKGKGNALHRGILRAQNKKVILFDADLPFALEHLELVLSKVQEGILVCGKRFKKYGYSPLRNAMSVFFSKIRNLKFPHLSNFDSQSCLKAFFKNDYLECVASGQSSGYFFDVELLHSFYQQKRTIRSHNFVFYHRKQTHFEFKEALSAFWQLLRV